MEAQRFSYRQFFARNDTGAFGAFAVGGPDDEDDDEPIDDLPPPAWFRRSLSTDPFPACEALLQWPTNYPVEADADLSDAEWAEVDPTFFRYSEPELEGWAGIVRMVVDSFEAPIVAPPGSRPLLVDTKKRHDEQRACEVIEMAYGNQAQIVQQQPVRPKALPPIAKWSGGDINVCAWSNTAPSGGRFITLTVDRRYRGEQGWKSTRSLRLDDVPMILALLQQAFNQLALRHQHAENVGLQVLPSPEGGLAPSGGLADADTDADESVYGG